jgi:alkanesulfonate monooxygenase SsuD/methylene tetrahydromethanopterin reductase-like flavin-dependent oxidoreductase (luciferase family)
LKVFVEIGRTAVRASRSELRDHISALEEAGATGVSVSDHMFTSDGGAEGGRRLQCDPLTTLAAVAGLSDHLELLTIVMNTGWLHPAFIFRQFSQLALLVGGERVTAGIGAGWNAEEFAAIGLGMSPFAQRMDRFEETLQVGRQLYGSGLANFDGKYVVVRDLPLSPVPADPPRLMVGGGSERALELAGRYADVVDLQGHPKYGTLVGSTADKAAADVHRRALTTVDDLAERMKVVGDAATAAGRPAGAVQASVQISCVAYWSKSDRERMESSFYADWANVQGPPLASNPFVLVGEPAEIAGALVERQEAFGLSQISLSDRSGIAGVPADPLRFCREVMPLLN